MKKRIVHITLGLLTAAFGFWIALCTGRQINWLDAKTTISLEVLNTSTNEFELFYDVPNYAFSQKKIVKGSNQFQWVAFELEHDTFSVLRLDPGTFSSKVYLRNIKLEGPFSSYTLPADSIFALFEPTNQVISCGLDPEKGVEIITLGNDPFLVAKSNLNHIFQKMESERRLTALFPYGVAIFFSVLCLIGYYQLAKRIPEWKLDDAWVGAFFLVLAAPMLYNLMRDKFPAYDTEERRDFVQFPPFKLSEIVTYPKAYSAYYNDNFGFRKELIRAQNLIKYTVFSTSGNPEKVIVGENGWLFGAMDFMKEDFQHSIPFTEEDLNAIQRNLEQRFTYFKNKGIRYYLFIPPAKHSIYSEFMPWYLGKKGPYSRLDQVLLLFKNHPYISIIDCRNELMEQKRIEQVFYKRDTHWNYVGAYVGYKKLMQAIQQDFPALRPLEWNEIQRTEYVNRNMNLAMFLSLGMFYPEKEDYTWIIHPNKIDSNISVNYPTQYVYQIDVFSQADTNLPKMVMHHDSYTMSNRHLINQHFERSVYLWTHVMMPAIYELEKPDIILHEMAETSIRYLITDNPPEMSAQP